MVEAVVLFLVKYGVIGVIIAAFFEAIIFPPPVEVILLPVMAANPQHAVYYALVTVGVSALGSTVGYYIGKKAGRVLLEKFFGKDKIQSVKNIYDRYGIFAIITSAFTPIPYEAYTLSAGAFRMDFVKYIAATFISRILRYIPTGIAFRFWGGSGNSYIGIWIGLVLLALGVVYLFIKKKLDKRG